MARDSIGNSSMSGSMSLGGRHLFILLFLSVGCWSCAPVNSEVHSALVIGVIDPQRILQETTKGQELTDNLNAFMKNRQALVELEQRELRDMEEDLRAQRTVLSQAAREMKEEQFRQKMGAYQQKVADLNREVQAKQAELQNEFRREVGAVVEQIAHDRNLGLVLEHGANSGTVYYQPSWDISTNVIQTLNQKSQETPSP